MQKYGLDAIEVFHSSHTHDNRIDFLNIANNLGLLVSGGSDFHGINTKPDIQIWRGKNDNLKLNDKLTIIKEITR